MDYISIPPKAFAGLVLIFGLAVGFTPGVWALPSARTWCPTAEHRAGAEPHRVSGRSRSACPRLRGPNLLLDTSSQVATIRAVC